MSSHSFRTIAELENLGEVSLQTGPFGTQLKASEYVDKGIPVINVRNIGFGDVKKEDLEYLNDAKAEKLHQHRLRKGDIVFGRKGAVERHALIDETVNGWIQGSDCLRLRIKSQDICGRYLSHYFKTKAHQDWMQALCSFGATMSSLNQDIVRRISFPALPIVAQKKITATLTAYDELIENNQRRIALLEKMAEEIYREWFVRMRFPGHEKVKKVKGVPEGWSFDKASMFFSLVKGKSYAAEELTDDRGHMPFISLKSFNRGGGYREDGLKYYSGRYRSEQVVYQNDVVMAVTDMTQDRAVIGRVARMPDLGEKGAVISLDTVKLVPKNIHKTFLYAYMRHSGFANFIKEFANGANVLHLKPDLITQQKIIIPPIQLQNKFAPIAEPLYAEADLLGKANTQLVKMRDMLLPRLISGKLSVEHLDIKLPPGMEEHS
ncbi:restriction endonuclease subunit S [Nitrosomonas sp. Nm166]|uniref:restriction endonuclease subunit S n=1 Tax=Nitrosomonas sp. Nm166 TaxID=1881054 RepID=UPI0008EBC240|nr:restriction endonuclease subunit S [Nitrosomonas sp. Nm166]SFD85857.1 type I restriction enzyme, S subunit [Nitrosomonas sp. Nm166]